MSIAYAKQKLVRRIVEQNDCSEGTANVGMHTSTTRSWPGSSTNRLISACRAELWEEASEYKWSDGELDRIPIPPDRTRRAK